MSLAHERLPNMLHMLHSLLQNSSLALRGVLLGIQVVHMLYDVCAQELTIDFESGPGEPSKTSRAILDLAKSYSALFEPHLWPRESF